MIDNNFFLGIILKYPFIKKLSPQGKNKTLILMVELFISSRSLINTRKFAYELYEASGVDDAGIKRRIKTPTLQYA